MRLTTPRFASGAWDITDRPHRSLYRRNMLGQLVGGSVLRNGYSAGTPMTDSLSLFIMAKNFASSCQCSLLERWLLNRTWSCDGFGLGNSFRRYCNSQLFNYPVALMVDRMVLGLIALAWSCSSTRTTLADLLSPYFSTYANKHFPHIQTEDIPIIFACATVDSQPSSHIYAVSFNSISR